METVFSRVFPQDRTTFQKLLTIYQEAIEIREQKSAAAIAALLLDKRYIIVVSRTNQDVTGFAIAFFPENESFWLLEYMAVAAHVRSKGIGSALFRATLSIAGARTGGHPCLLEVDQPGATVSATNDPERRLRFYARLDCRRLAGLNYILPLEAPGIPPLMYLLIHGLNGENSVPKASVRSWLSTIYADVYGCAKDDPRIAVMLSKLPVNIELISV